MARTKPTVTLTHFFSWGAWTSERESAIRTTVVEVGRHYGRRPVEGHLFGSAGGRLDFYLRARDRAEAKRIGATLKRLLTRRSLPGSVSVAA